MLLGEDIRLWNFFASAKQQDVGSEKEPVAQSSENFALSFETISDFCLLFVFADAQFTDFKLLVLRQVGADLRIFELDKSHFGKVEGLQYLNFRNSFIFMEK